MEKYFYFSFSYKLLSAMPSIGHFASKSENQAILIQIRSGGASFVQGRCQASPAFDPVCSFIFMLLILYSYSAT